MTTIDFRTRSAKTEHGYIIKDGMPVNGFQLRQEPVTIDELESLYEAYKNSTPNTQRHTKSYFKAKKFEEMTTDELISGANREKAREDLELTLLQGILNGSVTWSDPKKWFWQSKKDKDFVILRSWVTGT